MSEGFNNAANYRKLCEPFPTVEAAKAAVTEFQRELYELRNKHHIKDLVYIYQITVMYGPDEEDESIGVGCFGNAPAADSLAAYGYGYLSAESSAARATMVRDAAKLANKSKAK